MDIIEDIMGKKKSKEKQLEKKFPLENVRTKIFLAGIIPVLLYLMFFSGQDRDFFENFTRSNQETFNSNLKNSNYILLIKDLREVFILENDSFVFKGKVFDKSVLENFNGCLDSYISNANSLDKQIILFQLEKNGCFINKINVNQEPNFLKQVDVNLKLSNKNCFYIMQKAYDSSLYVRLLFGNHNKIYKNKLMDHYFLEEENMQYCVFE